MKMDRHYDICGCGGLKKKTSNLCCKCTGGPNKGKKLTLEHRKKLSEVRKLKPNRYWLGKTRPSVTGGNSIWWKGGISTYERKLWLNNRRRVRKTQNGGSHSYEEWQAMKEKYNFMCLCCKQQQPEITLSIDHIIPISRGGKDDISNIQPLCRTCNSRKHANIIDYKLVTNEY